MLHKMVYIRKNILRPEGRFRPMRLLRLDGRVLLFCTKDAHPLEKSNLSSTTNYSLFLANTSTLPAYSPSISGYLPQPISASSFSSIPGFRDNSTTNDPINLISAPSQPHRRGPHTYILIIWGTDEVRKRETIFPFKQDSQKFTISHFSDKWGESPTHTKSGSAGGESHGRG